MKEDERKPLRDARLRLEVRRAELINQRKGPQVRILLRGDDPDLVYYLEMRGRGVFLRAAPIDVSRLVRDAREVVPALRGGRQDREQCRDARRGVRTQRMSVLTTHRLRWT